MKYKNFIIFDKCFSFILRASVWYPIQTYTSLPMRECEVLKNESPTQKSFKRIFHWSLNLFCFLSFGLFLFCFSSRSPSHTLALPQSCTLAVSFFCHFAPISLFHLLVFDKYQSKQSIEKWTCKSCGFPIVPCGERIKSDESLIFICTGWYFFFFWFYLRLPLGRVFCSKNALTRFKRIFNRIKMSKALPD